MAAHLMEAKIAATAARNAHLQSMNVHHMDLWTRSWKKYQNRTDKPSVVQATPLGKNRSILLRKAESALATQIRTEKIGLADFSIDGECQESTLQPALADSTDRPPSM